MTRKLIASVVVLLVAVPCLAEWGDSCRYSQPREAAVSTEGATTVRFQVGPGFLRIKGRADLDQVRVSATACAKTEAQLEQVQLVGRRTGDQVVIETHGPDNYRLDLTVELPAELAVDIDDSSGSIKIANLAGGVVIDDSSGEIVAVQISGGLSIDDSSGEIDVSDIQGDLDIEDSSGEITVRRVTGSVSLHDSSGDIEVEHVERDVVVHADSSGDISVVDVGGDLRIKSDGSGDIEAERINGDLIVKHDTSGDIQYDQIGGTVSVPH